MELSELIILALDIWRREAHEHDVVRVLKRVPCIIFGATDVQLDDRWWVDRSTIYGSWKKNVRGRIGTQWQGG